ncbi:MAG: ParB/RepB/Spo0J family partition protein [Phycisphaerales bacterium]|nr:ParB/RepB/Spo0J family partition protein [Phycisphaerales bacterium]
MAETPMESVKVSGGARAATSRLGRGLGSLIPAAPLPMANAVALAATTVGSPVKTGAPGRTAAAVPTSRPPSAEPTMEAITEGNGGSIELPIIQIARNSRQPRERFDDRTLQGLADSITQNGLLQPIVVRRLSVPRGTMIYELIAGERRMRAFEKLGKVRIPAIIRLVDEKSSGVLALVENIQREDLNPIERSDALKRLILEFSWTQQQAADRVGLDRASVANLLRLGDLDPFVSGCVREGRLSQGHAKALLSIDDHQARRAVAERALHDEWSVRQVEREVQRLKGVSTLAAQTSAKPLRRASAQITDLEKRLGAHLGTRVQLTRGKKLGSGKLTIDFYSLDQFDGLLSRVGFDPNNLAY